MDQQLRDLVEHSIKALTASTALDGYRRCAPLPEFSEQTVDLIARIVGEILADPALMASLLKTKQPSPQETEQFIDPITGKNLLMRATSLFKDRPQHKMTPEQFIQATEWNDLATDHLLYCDHLRRSDGLLYAALSHRARLSGDGFAAYMFKVGVISRDYLFHPPPGFERQADLIKAMRARQRAQSFNKTAAQILSK